MNPAVLLLGAVLIGSDPTTLQGRTETKDSLAGRWRVVRISFNGGCGNCNHRLEEAEIRKYPRWIFGDTKLEIQGHSLNWSYDLEGRPGQGHRAIDLKSNLFTVPGFCSVGERYLSIRYDPLGKRRPNPVAPDIWESRTSILLEREE